MRVDGFVYKQDASTPTSVVVLVCESNFSEFAWHRDDGCDVHLFIGQRGNVSFSFFCAPTHNSAVWGLIWFTSALDGVGFVLIMGDDAVTLCAAVKTAPKKNTIMYYVVWHNPPRSEQVRYMKLHKWKCNQKLSFQLVEELSDSRASGARGGVEFPLNLSFAGVSLEKKNLPGASHLSCRWLRWCKSETEKFSSVR